MLTWFIHFFQDSESKFAEVPIHMGLGRNVAGDDIRASPSLDSMGTYTAGDPPQDEPGTAICGTTSILFTAITFS